ncbi:hypothetical protein GF342_03785 [Candidatus Woesearchaeota archaeon]|nr:hypothetical protein [Candidatus Woesearchaeota archaeon]
MYRLEHCTTKAAFKAEPTQKTTLDLETLRHSYTVLLDAGLVIVLRINNTEVITHSYGELLIKTDDKNKAEHIAQTVYTHKT